MQSSDDVALGRFPYAYKIDPLEYYDKPSKKNYRPKMACHQCRDRKVRCDRVKPCNACCNRGRPKECVFPKDANNKAIDQSQEIKLLRKALQDRERRISELEQVIDRVESGEGEADGTGPDSQKSSFKHPSKQRSATKRVAKPKRFRNDDPKENLYFGCLSISEVIHEFDKLKNHPRRPTLSHLVPRGVDIYAHQDANADPFPCFWLSKHGIDGLIKDLPPNNEILSYIKTFDSRAQICCFPHVPNEITVKQVEEFLSNVETNACINPSMLALIFASMALGVQFSTYDKNAESVSGAVEGDTAKGDVFIAAAMHALRLSSYMNRPTLLSIQTLLMIGPYLINCGKFLDSWTLFGTTIRLAHSMGLHRNPAYIDPSPPLKECLIRQTIWWWILHMDQHYSVTLGRPLGISGIGDCPSPTPLTTNSTVLRLATYINQFTILARHILSCDDLDNNRIDEYSDRLLQLLDTLPRVIQFDETWLDPETEIPEWPLEAHATMYFSETHNYLILLNRQRQENSQSLPDEPPSSGHGTSRGDATRSEDKKGYSRVLRCCRELLKAFAFFTARVRPALKCWTMGQQAFNAAMILTLSLFETRNSADWAVVSAAYHTFKEMRDWGIHPLAKMACERLMELFRELETLDVKEKTEGKEKVMSNHGMMLLEDPGLQGFIGERYAPLSFEMVGTDIPLPLDTGPSWVKQSSTPDLISRKQQDVRQRSVNPHDVRYNANFSQPLDLRSVEGVNGFCQDDFALNVQQLYTGVAASQDCSETSGAAPQTLSNHSPPRNHNSGAIPRSSWEQGQSVHYG